jgi:hypothetical protein
MIKARVKNAFIAGVLVLGEFNLERIKALGKEWVVFQEVRDTR